MPIKIPDKLPVRARLEEEGLMVMDEGHAICQDIRPLRLAVLNLMPLKQKTELQLARVIGATPLQVELTLLTTATYHSSHVASNHLAQFYKTFHEVHDERFDGLIITGAPVEHLPFEEVFYWEELVDIMNWSRTHVYSTFGICWAAQALLYHHYGIEKHALPAKRFGVFRHRVANPYHPLVRGFDDEVTIPVSRHTETHREDLVSVPSIEILMDSKDAGLCLMEDRKLRQIYMFNHLEYDSIALRDEYVRDQERGLAIPVPENYFPNDDPSHQPSNSWRAHGHLLYSNWINQTYQSTPFDLAEIGLGSLDDK